MVLTLDNSKDASKPPLVSIEQAPRGSPKRSDRKIEQAGPDQRRILPYQVLRRRTVLPASAQNEAEPCAE